jgi:hypothetical protein
MDEDEPEEAEEAETEQADEGDEEFESTKFVVRFPGGLAEKLRGAAEEGDMLPSELIRQVVRDFLNDDLVYADEEEEA